MKIKDIKANWWLVAAAAIMATLLRIYQPLTFDECEEILGAFWDTGNRWARRTIYWMVAYPFILIAIALFGNLTINTLVAIAIPLFAIVMLLMSNIGHRPLIVAGIAAFDEGKAALRWLMFALGMEAVAGLYFGLVPITNDYRLIPILLLVVMALMFLSLSGVKKLGFIKGILWLLTIGITVIFFYGGRDEVKKIGTRTGEGDETSSAFVTKGHMEDGYWVAPEKTTIKPRMEAWEVREDLSGGKDTRITTNCREPVTITALAPGESVQIRHVDFGGWEMKNRCSYNAAGGAVPIYGETDKVTRPRFRYDLPFPEMPAGAVGFSLEDANGNIVAYDYIKSAGNIIYMKNSSGKTVNAMLRYNYMKAFTENPTTRQQIGWDGSTATFVATRFTK